MTTRSHHPRSSSAAPALPLIVCALALAALGGCQELVGIEDTPVPLATIRVKIEGLAALVKAEPEARLRVALVWGDQWQPKPLCIIPPESPALAKVLAAGCPDAFRFDPRRVAANAPVDIDKGTATLTLYNAPSADAMIGDISSRIVFGSLMLYDDRDDDSTLDLDRQPWRPFGEQDPDHDDGGVAGAGDAGPGGSAPGDAGPDDAAATLFPDLSPTVARRRDVAYAASFVSMTKADIRIAFREGAFNERAAYYPRVGCSPPPAGFSAVSSGGFSAAAALAAAVSGKLPSQDPKSCKQHSLAEPITLVVRSADEMREAVCRTRNHVHYYPPRRQLDLSGHTWACAGLPYLGIGPKPLPLVQLVVASPSGRRCSDTLHYTLRGCRHDANCKTPDWDFTKKPPAWWPCPVSR